MKRDKHLSTTASLGNIVGFTIFNTRQEHLKRMSKLIYQVNTELNTAVFVTISIFGQIAIPCYQHRCLGKAPGHEATRYPDFGDLSEQSANCLVFEKFDSNSVANSWRNLRNVSS